MNSILKKLAMGVIIAAIAVYAFQAVFLTHMVASHMTETLGVEVSIESISISWNQVTIKGLFIDNIAEGKIRPALDAEYLEIQAKLTDLLAKDKVTIEKLSIDKPQIAVETYNVSGKDNNWSRMMRHFKKPASTASGDNSEHKRTWEIKHLVVTNIQLQLRHPSVGDQTLDLQVPDIELHNVKSFSQIPTQAVTQAVMDEVLKNTLIQLPDLVKTILRVPTGLLNRAVNTTMPVTGILRGVLLGV